MIFEQEGVIEDVFISTKKRKSSSDYFDFVRFKRYSQALSAIKNLNGLSVRGKALKVSLARFNKGGAPFSHSNQKVEIPKKRVIQNPAFRDKRSYSEVLLNKRKFETMKEEEVKSIPISFTITVAAVDQNESMLERAIIAENTEVINLSKAESMVSTICNTVSGMYSLSPTKLLIVFECKENVYEAVSIGSSLWNIFDDVRVWSEGEVFDDRLVWLECFGVHPRYWSEENMRKIGEKWGPVLSVDNRIDSLHSLTFARMLVRTKAQNRIDTRVKLLFDHSSCDVWVKEVGNFNECLVATHDSKQPGRRSTHTDVSGNTQPLFHDRIKDHDTDPIHFDCSKPSNNTMLKECTVDGLEMFEDPFLPFLCSKIDCVEKHVWIDPIVVNEMIHSSNDVLTSPISNKPSKSRGRPRKAIDQPSTSTNPALPPSCCLLEAHKTWDTVKPLGISSNDENAALSALRKSKRILILEGNTT